MAFSYLQVTKLLNNTMEDLIKIHFELLLVTEETVSQSSLLNPAQSSLWAIVQFADEDLAGSCILTGR